MRLEVLITKYLDGELTSAEDRELRQLLSQNPEAKNTFDLSISLHHALRRDAVQTAPSAQLMRETEDLILMSILSQSQPEPQPEKKREKKFLSFFSTGTSVLGGLVAVLLPLFTSSIGFESIPFVRHSADRLAGTGVGVQQSDAATVNSQPALRVQRTATRTSAEGRVSRVRAERSLIAAASAGNGALAAGMLASAAQPAFPVVSGDLGNASAFAQNKENEAVVSVSDFNSSSNIPLTAAITTGPSSYPSQLSTVSASMPLGLPSSGSLFGNTVFGERVTLSTTLGHDALDVTSGDPLGLSFVSQSLAYSIGDAENAGIEVGYLWFTYGRPVQKFIPNTSNSNGWGNNDPYGYDSKPQGMKVQGTNAEIEGQSDTSPLNPDMTDGEYITDMQILPKQTWWGAAFYERTFTHNERISLQGRVGAGGSNDGALAYVRATGLYRLLDNLSVSVGVDARGMMLRTPYVASQSSTIKTSLSFIYGLQIHL